MSSTQVVGSLANASDGPISDIDIVVGVEKCPGEKNCEIVKLMGDHIMDSIDLYCEPNKF